eukprot:647514-Rhodomonas_salina.1
MIQLVVLSSIGTWADKMRTGFITVTSCSSLQQQHLETGEVLNSPTFGGTRRSEGHWMAQDADTRTQNSMMF